MADQQPSRRGPWWAKLVAGAMLVIVAVPVTQNWHREPIDSFPLSYYPMFSKDRGESVEIIYLVGIRNQGERSHLPISYVGDGGFHQVRKQINRTAERGELDAMCQMVAQRVARSTTSDDRSIVEVRFVRGTFAIRDYFAGRKEPVQEMTLARAVVDRRESR